MTSKEKMHELRLIQEGVLFTQREKFLLYTITDLQAQLSEGMQWRQKAYEKTLNQLVKETIQLREELSASREKMQAERAAVLEFASQHTPIVRLAWIECSCGWNHDGSDRNISESDAWNQHIRALITTTDRSALDRHDAELRKSISVEGMERELCGHFKSNLIGDEYGHFACDACTVLEEKVRVESDKKDAAYSERDQLVCALSKLFPASLERHPDEDVTWEDDWRWIVFIDLPTGQATWHIHDSEVPMFKHLQRLQGRKWDGHTTTEKYQRLRAIPIDTPPAADRAMEAVCPRCEGNRNVRTGKNTFASCPDCHGTGKRSLVDNKKGG
jgi:hypothetical protein